jgi:glycosidase
VWALIGALALVGCAPPVSQPGDAAPGIDAARPDAEPNPVGVRACGVRVAYRPPADATAVAVAGGWDWSARTPMTDPDGDGEYAAEVTVPAGLYPYKLVVTRPGVGDEWLLDPGNPYRAYDGGIENSGLRVADCARPLVEVVSHQVEGDTATTRLRLWRGAGGAALTTVDAAVRFEAQQRPVEAVLDGDVVTVTLPDLPPGKHTLVVDARDAAGLAAEPVLVPSWVEAEAFDWRDAVIYMVMTDRFRNGNPGNDPEPAPGAEAAADFLGGDLAGVTAALEDGTLEALGVRALWLSPVVRNTSRVHVDAGHGVTGYHGYWPVEPRAVDPRLGTEEELEAMVTAAHRRGIRVLMDFVINHVHEDHVYAAQHPEWLRTGCLCGEPGCDWTERRLDCSFRAYLPDVDWQNLAAGEQMIADALWWLERFDLDGLRVDAVKHVEDAAVFNLSTRVQETFERGGVDYFLLGETAMGWSGDDLAANLSQYETISRYVGPDALSGQFDFVLYHASAYRVWADDAAGMVHLDYWTRQSHAQYPATAVMTPFVGSHDSERLLSLCDLTSADPLVRNKWVSQGLPPPPADEEPYRRASLALTWLLTVPGAPLLYYGDEYGEHGGGDPDNRHPWTPPSARSAWQQALHADVARVGRLRQEVPALRRGGYATLGVTEDVLVFARQYRGEAAIVALNRAPTAQAITVPLPPELAGAATVVDRLDPALRTLSTAGGSVQIPLGPRSAAVLTAP